MELTQQNKSILNAALVLAFGTILSIIILKFGSYTPFLQPANAKVLMQLLFLWLIITFVLVRIMTSIPEYIKYIPLTISMLISISAVIILGFENDVHND